MVGWLAQAHIFLVNYKKHINYQMIVTTRFKLRWSINIIIISIFF